MAWGKAGSTTLSGTGDALTTPTLSSNDALQYLYHGLPTGGELTEYMTMGSGGTKDTGSNYANRVSSNGGSDSTFTSRANIVNGAKSGATTPEFGIGYIFNIAGKEKLLISHHVNASGNGAGTAPERSEAIGKHVQTSVVDDIVSFDNTGSGDFASDSNLSVLGSDLTPAAAIPFPTNVQLGSRAEITDTRKMYNFSKLTFDFSASSSGAVSNQPTDATEVGQLITSTTHRGKKAKSATFYVKRTGSPSGTMVYKVRKSSDNIVVATSTGTSASALSTSTTAVTLDFNDEVIPSENIRVTVSGVTGSSGNIVTIYGGGADTVADQTLSVWGGSSWTEYGNDCAGKLTFTEEWQEIGA